MTFEISIRRAGPLEEGSYRAILKSVEEKETKYGQRLMWLFQVPEHGAEVAGFTSLSPSTQSKAYLWAIALNPRIKSEVSWCPEDVVGKECVLGLGVVEGEKGRKNRIAGVKPSTV